MFSRLGVIGEASGPQILTSSIPGPKSSAYLSGLSSNIDISRLDIPIDLSNSLGNYCKDLDGNEFLDLSCQMGTLSLGYNHPRLLQFSKSPEVTRHVTSRVSMSMFNTHDLQSIVDSAFSGMYPANLDYIYTFICDNCTNEVALKFAFIEYQARKRDDPKSISQTDLDSCMTNSLPGTPNLSVLSFEGSVHGKMMGGLAISSSQDFDSSGLPSKAWPKVGVPNYQYPLDLHQQHNLDEDQRVLAEVERTIDACDSEVVGVIIEPIQTENAGFVFSANFANQLRSLLTSRGLAMIVDETSIGYHSTGKMWAHEHWALESPPDIVSVASKMMSGAVFTTKRFVPTHLAQHMHTWWGDVPRLALLAKQNEFLEEAQVASIVSEAGYKLKSKLEKLVRKGLIEGVRGMGTFLTFDLKDAAARDALVEALRLNGVLVTRSGERSINLRPSLIFEKKHAKIFTKILKKCLVSV